MDWRLTSWSLVVLNLVLVQSILFRPRLFVFPVLMVDENFQTEPSSSSFAVWSEWICRLSLVCVCGIPQTVLGGRFEGRRFSGENWSVAEIFSGALGCSLFFKDKYLYAHTCTHICTNTHAFTYTHTHTHAHTHTHIHVCGGVHPVRRGGTTEHWLRTDIKSANKLTRGMPTTVHVLLQSADH